MSSVEIIDRQLIGDFRVRSRPHPSDYLLLVFLSALLIMASSFSLHQLLDALMTESEFIQSLLGGSAGGIVIVALLEIGAVVLTLFGVGIVGGQFIRQQTVIGLIFTSVVISIGGVPIALLALLNFSLRVVLACVVTVFIFGFVAAFFGYLYGFVLLRRGIDWLDEHGYLFGIRNRFYCYLIPGYWLLIVGMSGVVIWTVFSFLRVSAWSVVDVIPFLLGYGLLYAVVKAMTWAHTLVTWRNLYPLSRKRRAIRILFSVLLSLGLPLMLFVVLAGTAFVASQSP